MCYFNNDGGWAREAAGGLGTRWIRADGVHSCREYGVGGKDWIRVSLGLPGDLSSVGERERVE